MGIDSVGVVPAASAAYKQWPKTALRPLATTAPAMRASRVVPAKFAAWTIPAMLCSSTAQWPLHHALVLHPSNLAAGHRPRWVSQAQTGSNAEAWGV